MFNTNMKLLLMSLCLVEIYAFDSRCRLGPDPGTCSSPGEGRLQFFFDPTFAECKQFRFSGCGGNENRFVSLLECKHICLKGDRICRFADEAQLVGKHPVKASLQSGHYVYTYFYSCEERCRLDCDLLSRGASKCVSWSIERNWMVNCKCFIFSRRMGTASLDESKSGVTWNKVCPDEEILPLFVK